MCCCNCSRQTSFLVAISLASASHAPSRAIGARRHWPFTPSSPLDVAEHWLRGVSLQVGPRTPRHRLNWLRSQATRRSSLVNHQVPDMHPSTTPASTCIHSAQRSLFQSAGGRQFFPMVPHVLVDVEMSRVMRGPILTISNWKLLRKWILVPVGELFAPAQPLVARCHLRLRLALGSSFPFGRRRRKLRFCLLLRLLIFDPRDAWGRHGGAPAGRAPLRGHGRAIRLIICLQVLEASSQIREQAGCLRVVGYLLGRRCRGILRQSAG
mmetsp:Transcript_60094/g.143202  ORF Transcript_60094/g.143202 Transcript_60094/m.143202 type:complete len:267 (-) Transcript_60094:240-1040(-)